MIDLLEKEGFKLVSIKEKEIDLDIPIKRGERGKEFISVGADEEVIKVNDEIEKNGWRVGQRVKVINENGIAYFKKQLKEAKNIVIVGFTKNEMLQDEIVLQLDGGKVVTKTLYTFPQFFGLKVPDEQKVTEEEVLGLYPEEDEKNK
ncbi:MAG: hypothetical protein A3C58_01075 [Candidatus Staskawiczbacteria bacterium RIFCSPHIGHO2_02_FULL_34_10]|uniref:Uncharacterized protein n=1 Tax=Candidatus Staskawiczbacteria bacterium RIFCSPHIGHO2_02_FULL_34_10 TaxID=1802205 RepID=A0A1G2HWH7_9BACT|nr:MAG: hypothetical protein A3C58_01075 [Candidatus Staskawiczbacteria bacterium RIFCSPHIGHO2_02_FULL_34_10]